TMGRILPASAVAGPPRLRSVVRRCLFFGGGLRQVARGPGPARGTQFLAALQERQKLLELLGQPRDLVVVLPEQGVDLREVVQFWTHPDAGRRGEWVSRGWEERTMRAGPTWCRARGWGLVPGAKPAKRTAKSSHG